MDRETPIQLLSSQQSAQARLIEVLRRFLSVEETDQIIKQFQTESWIPNGQVLWSGILRQKAQEWADRHRLQTLTTAMGPLMDEKHPDCLKSKKSPRQWSRYVHGASAIFAWRIAQGEKVIVLSPPPPERFHPSGLSYYQLIEEPIIRGLFGQDSVQKIITTHPMIKESDDEQVFYELWPNDRSDEWMERFGSRTCKVNWRKVGHSNDLMELRNLMTSSERHILSSEQLKHLEKHKVGFIKPTYSILLLSLFLLIPDKLPILILFGLLYSLFDKIVGADTAIRGERAIFQTAESTPTMIAPKDINIKQETLERLRDELKPKRKACNKARKKARRKLKDEAKAKRKAIDEAYQKAIKKFKGEVKAKRKAVNETYQKAIKKLKDEARAKGKCLNKTGKKAAKRLKNEEKAKRNSLEKAQWDAAKRARNEEKVQREALKKAYQEAVKELKDEERAK